MSRQKQLLNQALAQAATYQEWLSVAQALDEYDGLAQQRCLGLFSRKFNS